MSEDEKLEASSIKVSGCSCCGAARRVVLNDVLFCRLCDWVPPVPVIPGRAS